MPAPRATDRLAAIDIGSNAIRLLIAERGEGGRFQPIESLREPVRLGADAFAKGRFTPATFKKAVAAFVRFRKILDAHGVSRVRAVATSAMRDTANAGDLIAAVEKKSGIRIEVVSGIFEAQLVFDAVGGAVPLEGRSAVLFDMGGGSVEITVVRAGLAMASETLPLGCVRLMQELRRRKWPEARVEELIAPWRGTVLRMLRANLGDVRPDVAVGTGGNLECLGKLRTQLLPKIKGGKVKLTDLDLMVPKLLALTPARRAKLMGLRPDRADVIAIAGVVLRMLMQDGGVYCVLTPGVGLKDGVLYAMAKEDEQEAKRRWPKARVAPRRSGPKAVVKAAAKKASKKVAKKAAKKTAKKTAKKAAKKRVKKVVKKGAPKPVRKIAQKAAKKVGRKKAR